MAMLLVVLVVLLSTVVPALAAEEKRISPQAQRMKDCNAHARDRQLAGDARKQFMSECLKGDGSGRSNQGAASPGTQGQPSPR